MCMNGGAPYDLTVLDPVEHAQSWGFGARHGPGPLRHGPLLEDLPELCLEVEAVVDDGTARCMSLTSRVVAA